MASDGVVKMSPFQWTAKKNRAAIMLAEGYTIDETADAVGVSSRTIDRWKSDMEFAVEVDRLSVMVGIANRGERLRMAKRIVRKLLARQQPTQKDLLEWLKYAQSETDGAKLDLTTLFDAAASVAGSGSDGVAGEEQEPDGTA
jgi:transcriptional regulator with XRE-family HTH domain